MFIFFMNMIYSFSAPESTSVCVHAQSSTDQDISSFFFDGSLRFLSESLHVTTFTSLSIFLFFVEQGGSGSAQRKCGMAVQNLKQIASFLTRIVTNFFSAMSFTTRRLYENLNRTSFRNNHCTFFFHFHFLHLRTLSCLEIFLHVSCYYTDQYLCSWLTHQLAHIQHDKIL